MTSATATQPAPSSSGSLKDVVAAPTSIATIDGQAGKLIYRGYTIEDLAEHASFEEVSYLLWNGELPRRSELDSFNERLAAGRAIPDVLIEHLRLMPAAAHPLAALR